MTEESSQNSDIGDSKNLSPLSMAEAFPDPESRIDDEKMKMEMVNMEVEMKIRFHEVVDDRLEDTCQSDTSVRDLSGDLFFLQIQLVIKSIKNVHH